MKYTQLLSHEIGTDCNLSFLHKDKCPISRRDRYDHVDTSRVLDDNTIINNVKIAKKMGFQGMASWHFYCEPLLYMDRIERLSRELNGVRNLLWTNGTLIGKQIDPERLKIFSKIVVSNYEKINWEFLKAFVHDVMVLRGHLDKRMSKGKEKKGRCLRLYHELIIDYYGNWRLCCADYVGTAVHLNVFVHGFEGIVKEFLKFREIISKDPQPDDVPSICKTCRVLGRNIINRIVDEPYLAAMRKVGET